MEIFIVLWNYFPWLVLSSVYYIKPDGAPGVIKFYDYGIVTAIIMVSFYDLCAIFRRFL